MEITKNKLTDFRKELHKYPELSDTEKQTSIRVKKFISSYSPDEIIESIGGYGIAFIYNGLDKGPTVMIRSELDALPIDEINDFSHRSERYGISHKCGHDGHMAIVSGLAEGLKNNPPAKGRVVLLFQPAEENGQGARQVIEDSKFDQIKPDYIFALHNLPGYPKSKIVIKKGVFSSASTGLIVRLTGKTSHAAEPEKGLNPAFVMASVIKDFEKYTIPVIKNNGMQIITLIHTRLGEKAFGTSPGFAEMMFTIRATYTKEFEALKKYVLESIQNKAAKQKLLMQYEWVEEFPNTENDPKCTDIVTEAAKLSELEIETLQTPFRWSEDFGYFLNKFPGAFFGLGSGTNQPALHNPDFDFPDEIIETGVEIFTNVYKLILK